MFVSICGRDLTPYSDLLAYAERRLQFTLGRFGESVQRVRIYLNDAPGGCNAIDKHCRMVARMKQPARDVVVDGFDGELEALIDRTADRLGQSVGREFEFGPRVGVSSAL